MLVKCHQCRGAKQVLGLGLMYQDCKVCDGEGWVSKEPPMAKVEDNREKKIKGKKHDE